MTERNGAIFTELYRRHRPRKLTEIVGQEAAVRQLQDMLDKGSVPHALMLCGSSGTGKTTVARIIARKLGCRGIDFQDVNCAALESPMDTVRSIQQRMGSSPVMGKVRVWVMEECFAAHTLVDTPTGPKPISVLRVDNTICNLAGNGGVKRVFCNRVPLGHVLRLEFSDGTVLFTTRRHRFLTESGWEEAQNLQWQYSLLGKSRYTRGIATSVRRGLSDEGRQAVRDLRGGVHPFHAPGSGGLFQEVLEGTQFPSAGNEVCTNVSVLRQGVRAAVSVQSPEVLLEEVFIQPDGCAEGSSPGGRTRLRNVWHSVYVENFAQGAEALLREGMRRQGEGEPEQAKAFTEGEFGASCEDYGIPLAVLAFVGIFDTSQETVTTDGSEQSCCRSGDRGEDTGDKGSQRQSSRLEGSSRGEWANYAATAEGLGNVRGGGSWVVNGYGHPHGILFWRWPALSDGSRRRLSEQLQGGRGASRLEGGDRSRWERASAEECYLKGQKEDRMPRRLRVVRSEVYERGCNDAAFVGVVSDRDRLRGYVEFWDLQVSGDPSYFVEGIPVHNCQSLSRAQFAQQALLRTLEDTPAHAYFILATTDPDKLIKTIHTRCTRINFRSLSEADLEAVLQSVAGKENFALTPAVSRHIVEASEGSARQAVVFLQQAMGGRTEQEQIDAVFKGDVKAKAFDLVKALLWERPKWSGIAEIIRGLDEGEDWERLRRLVLSVAATEVLKAGRNATRAALILDCFKSNFFDNGRSGLVLACFEAVRDAK